MNCLVHHVDLHSNDGNFTQVYLSQLDTLFGHVSRGLPLTWATGPSYDISKVSITSKRPTSMLNLEAMKLARKYDIPLLDFYTLTDRCVYRNCTSDGGHRSRYVNRMKAQMLLNNFCGNLFDKEQRSRSSNIFKLNQHFFAFIFFNSLNKTVCVHLL